MNGADRRDAAEAPSGSAEIIRRFLDAFNRGDYAVCLDTIAADVEWHPPPDIPLAAVSRGRDELIANWRDWLDAWEDYRALPEEIVEAPGNVVVVSSIESARGRDSGIEVFSRRVTGVYSLSEGRIVRFKAYLDRGEALAAAGMDTSR